MAFLDKKERIVDIVLTDRGRQLLSQNQLVIRHYAFSDDGVNYTGSLTYGAVSGSNVDFETHKTLLFEATQKFDKTKNLNSFLYTIPERSTVLADLQVGTNITSSINLERHFHIETITLETVPRVFVKKPVDIIVRAKVDKPTLKDRTKEFVLNQRIASVLQFLKGLAK